MSATPRGEAGFAGLAGLAFGLLFFVVGTLLVAYAWGVVDTKTALDAAARQAARAYVGAPDAASALAEASQAADTSLAGEGRDPARAALSLASGTFGRCERVTVRLSYPAPLLLLPILGPLGSGQLVATRHSELVEPYLSGPPGSARCG